MNNMKWWHPFTFASIPFALYIIVGELLYLWSISSSEVGLWVGNLLLSLLTLPTHFILGREFLTTLSDNLIQYFGYMDEPKYSDHRVLIEAQVLIFSNAIISFVGVFLVLFPAFALIRLTRR